MNISSSDIHVRTQCMYQIGKYTFKTDVSPAFLSRDFVAA